MYVKAWEISSINNSCNKGDHFLSLSSNLVFARNHTSCLQDNVLSALLVPSQTTTPLF